MNNELLCEIIEGDCQRVLKDGISRKFNLIFMDPPFNQNKEYGNYNDNLPDAEYWSWLERICGLIFEHTFEGGSIYFMQREKNAHCAMRVLEASGWTFQNLIIWKKKTSAVPSDRRYGKHYQIIIFATKGKTAKVFNKLRIDPPLLENEKYRRPNGMYTTDVWDDIRELTSGYFAGDEPLRFKNGERIHKQQSPVRLLLRIILSSSNIGDTVFDPFAGTGTTLVVAKQLKRNSIGIEISPTNVSVVNNRISHIRPIDNVMKYRKYYNFTENLDDIWLL